MNNILLEDIDPLNIKDTEGLYLLELKNKYISLRNIYHPDKRGTSNYDLFIRITDAISNHNLILKSCIMDKDFIQLRNGYNKYQDTEKKKKPIFAKDIKSITNDKFNKLYDEHKFEDEYDDGYGSIMDESGEREDINIEKTINNEGDFNNVFDNHYKKPTNEIIKYSVPNAINEYTYNNLCEKKTDYSGKTTNLNYKDYKKAFELEKMEEFTSDKQRTLKKYKKERENDKLLLSEEQERAIESYNLKQKRKESEHQNNLKEYGNKIAKYHSNNHMHFLE